MNIRPILRADLTLVLEMIQGLSAYHDDVAEVTFDQLERDTMGAAPWVRVLVAETSDQLVGYAGMVPRAKFHSGVRALDVHHLFVLKDWRSKGVGRALLDACGDCARSLGCANLTIGTAPDNIRAQKIYQSYGFEPMDKGGPSYKLALS